jgi:hypothetical protein
MTDERDPKLQSAYRALDAEEPPCALDEAVLAASRRALKVHPAPLVAPTGRRPWFVPLAAAAVLALAVGVTLHMQMEQPGVDGLPHVAGRAQPEAAAKPERPATTAPAGAPSAPAAGAASDLAMKEESKTPSTLPPPALAREKAAAPGAAGRAASVESEQRAREETARREAEISLAQARRATPEVRASVPQAAPAPAMAMAKRADAPAKDGADTPERELERIAELRTQGKHDEADKALAEFRKRHPEFKIPPAMLERVERR